MITICEDYYFASITALPEKVLVWKVNQILHLSVPFQADYSEFQITVQDQFELRCMIILCWTIEVFAFLHWLKNHPFEIDVKSFVQWKRVSLKSEISDTFVLPL
jgi:hypothetical protein